MDKDLKVLIVNCVCFVLIVITSIFSFVFVNETFGWAIFIIGLIFIFIINMMNDEKDVQKEIHNEK